MVYSVRLIQSHLVCARHAAGVGNSAVTRCECRLVMPRIPLSPDPSSRAVGDAHGQTCGNDLSPRSGSPWCRLGLNKHLPGEWAKTSARCRRRSSALRRSIRHSEWLVRLVSSISHLNFLCICVVENSLCFVSKGMNLIRACLFLKAA